MKIDLKTIIIVALGIWILFLVNCRGEKVITTPAKIVIKKVVDSFKVVVPVQKIKYVKGQTQYIPVEDTAFINSTNQLVNYYATQNDSLQKKLYADAVTIKDYTQDFIKYKDEITKKDTIYKINVSGAVRGTILNMKLDNTQFEHTIELPYQKSFRWRVLGGGEVGINKELNQGVIKANLMFQNKKSNITSLSYQKIGNSEFVLVGFNKNLFTRNK